MQLITHTCTRVVIQIIHCLIIKILALHNSIACVQCCLKLQLYILYFYFFR